MFRLIVFDLDGTLIDSRRDLADATNALLAERGAPPLDLDAVTAMVGEGAAVLVRRALTAAGLDPDGERDLDRFLALYDARLTVHTHPYPGVAAMLEALEKPCRLAVLTNKPARATHGILEGLDLGRYFQHVIGGDSSLGRKPAPGGLLHLCAALGVPPHHTLLVGDSPVDLATARNAGTAVCLARYGFGFRFDGVEMAGDELVIDSPAALVDLVSRSGDQRS